MIEPLGDRGAPLDGGESPRILVADDEDDVREVIVDTLRAAGYRVVSASDGETAVLLAREQRPDLVLLDVIMPRMDGYTTLTRLRGHSTTRDVPVVVLTGQPDPLFQSLSHGLGAVAHLAKPLVPAALLDAVRHVLAERVARLGEEQRIAAFLVERGFITAEQLGEARLVLQREGTRRLYQILLEMAATVAAMLDHRNTHALGHIVTIEDPLEFVLTPKRSVVSQREVGVDTASYAVGLRKALRQAADVIFVKLLPRAIEDGAPDGLQTLDQALLALHQQRKISEEDALRFADNPDSVRLRLRGVR